MKAHVNGILWLAMTLAFAGTFPAFGQNPPAFNCATTAVPPLLRAEGLTEQVGDIVLKCTGGTATAVGQPIPQTNLAIFLNTNITSRILSNGGSEALVLIDEPGSTTNPVQQLCPNLTGCVVTGNGGAGEPFDGTSAARPNVFQGIPAGRSVTFIGVPIDPPGAGKIRVFRITNIRGNVSAVATTAATVDFIPVQPVLALVSASGSTSLPIQNPQLTVGYALTGSTFSTGSVSAVQCSKLTNTVHYSNLSFVEGFSTAFKTRTIAGADPGGTGAQNIPGAIYNTESGFILPSLPGTGLASAGTRFRAVMRNIPPGVNVWVSTYNILSSASTAAQLTNSETGPYYPVTATTTLLGTNVAQLQVVNGTATAVWEVTAADPLATETFSFSFFFDSSKGLDFGTPPVTVNGTLAPAPPAFAIGDGVLAQSSLFPIPRFVDTSTALSILTFTACRTNLLFPFVTSEASFDTGISIANTSADPYGTSGQTGTCTLNAYGDTPSVFTTPPIVPGKTYALLSSTTFPGFQGYIIAVCNFQFAHAFAFVSDLGTHDVAMSYLALVLPEPARTIAPAATLPGAGEILEP